MSLTFTAYFSYAGAPKTGLTPAIDVYKVSDGTKVVDAQAMTELAGGHYKYVYAGADNTEDYVATADGGSGQLTGERYAPCSSGVTGAIQTLLERLPATIETLTPSQVLSIILAFVSGKSSGGGSGTIKFRNQADDTDRITMNVDQRGNRSSITIDISDL